MFTTHQHAEIFLGGGKAEPPIRLWSYVEQDARAPLLLVEVVRIVKRSNLRSILLISDVAELKHAVYQEGPKFKIKDVYVISPGGLDAGGSWRMDVVSGVYHVMEVSSGRLGVMYKTESGLAISTDLREWDESVRVNKTIYSSRL